MRKIKTAKTAHDTRLGSLKKPGRTTKNLPESLAFWAQIGYNKLVVQRNLLYNGGVSTCAGLLVLVALAGCRIFYLPYFHYSIIAAKMQIIFWPKPVEEFGMITQKRRAFYSWKARLSRF
ncbi:MAG: hypothetical protein HFE45_04250 [Oscillospiraceae bacterium]|nr:hypothetical protein [Oscillospiraceae bacterium]